MDSDVNDTTNEATPNEHNQEATSTVRRFRILPPRNARCSHCGCDEVSGLPSFSAGAGIAYRPIADDIICRRCGHIGPYDL